MALLDIKNVGFKDGDQIILEDISLSIESGDFVLLTGPSGSGKSTLLKLFSDLISPTSGQIYFMNKPVDSYDPIKLRREVAYVPQTPVLFPETVRDNMEFVYKSRGEELDEKKVIELMERLQLNNTYLDKEVINLSGGEKQRLSLVRSLLFKPKVLLLDEITSSLDMDNASTLESAIVSLNNRGITVVWISHEPERHKKFANKIINLEAGKVSQVEVR